MPILTVSIATGQEVLGTISARVRELGIVDGAVVSLVGAVASASVSNMDPDDESKDIVTEYVQPMELSGTGEIVDGVVHLHVVLGTHGDAALAGHLHSAVVGGFFVRAYVMPLSMQAG